MRCTQGSRTKKDPIGQAAQVASAARPPAAQQVAQSPVPHSNLVNTMDNHAQPKGDWRHSCLVPRLQKRWLWLPLVLFRGWKLGEGELAMEKVPSAGWSEGRRHKTSPERPAPGGPWAEPSCSPLWAATADLSWPQQWSPAGPRRPGLPSETGPTLRLFLVQCPTGARLGSGHSHCCGVQALDAPAKGSWNLGNMSSPGPSEGSSLNSDIMDDRWSPVQWPHGAQACEGTKQAARVGWEVTSGPPWPGGSRAV